MGLETQVLKTRGGCGQAEPGRDQKILTARQSPQRGEKMSDCPRGKNLGLSSAPPCD